MNDEQEWTILESEPPIINAIGNSLGRSETQFSLANGHLGMRGDYEESQPAWHRGTYVNGFHETEPIVYGEQAYGFARDHQTMLNLPDGRLIRLVIDGQEFTMAEGRCHAYRRSLDMRRGQLVRQLEWELPNGRRFALEVRRLVSFVRQRMRQASDFPVVKKGTRTACRLCLTVNYRPAAISVSPSIWPSPVRSLRLRQIRCKPWNR